MENKVTTVSTPNEKILDQIEKLQTQIDELQAAGAGKVEEIDAQVRATKKSKKMDKDAKAFELNELKNERVKCVEIQKANAPKIKELVSQGRALVAEYYNPLYAEAKNVCKDKTNQLRLEHKEKLAEIKTKQQKENAELLSSSIEDLAAAKKRLKISQKNVLTEEKLQYQGALQKAKDEKHNVYLRKYNTLQNLTYDKLNIKEKLEANCVNYAYNFKLKEFLMKNGLYIIIVLFMLFCIVSNPSLISIGAISNILNNFSTKVFFALGVAGLILLGGTDLSVGRMVTLGSLVTCMMLNPNSPTEFFGVSLSGIYNTLGVFGTAILALVLSIVLCTLFSMLAGYVSAKFKIHPFISTLGTSLIIWGIAGFGTNNVKTGSITNEALEIGGRFIGNISLILLYAIIAIVVVWFIWNKTKFGKNMYAVGGNQEAASVSGISVFKTTLLVFVMAGVLYGIGSFLTGIQTGSSSSVLGQGWELEAIAACVVGGISFSGGIGKVRGAVIGCLLFEILKYYLRDITGGSADITNIFIGAIIIIAVIFDSIKYLKKR